MPLQSEAALENGIIATLQKMNYEYVHIEEERNLYSSESFSATVANYLNSYFVQSRTAQLAQLMTGLMPNVLTLTTLTNRHNPMSRSRPRGRRICHEPQHESHDDCPI